MGFHDQENMGAVEHATRKIQKMVPFAWAAADAAEASEDLSKRNHGHFAASNASATAIIVHWSFNEVVSFEVTTS
jgi:hypothetical protein